MTPDNNKVHFLTYVTSLLIPQRMNAFNKEEKVKWYYPGLSFIQATFKQHFLYSIRSDQLCQISYIVISPTFVFKGLF
jgi:hypothetical protein